MEPQVIVSYTGIADSDITGAEMTFSRGVTPSTCMLRMIPQDSLSADHGNLQFNMGATNITFFDCALDHSTLRLYKGREGWRSTIQVKDRRWKWQYPWINGKYNQPSCDGTLKNKKSAKELAEILLDNLGEVGYDIEDVPDDCYPYVLWDESNTAKALADLAEKFGCVVILTLENKVEVKRWGHGSDLPESDQATNRTVEPFKFDHVATIPRKLLLETGPNLYQKWIMLEPVGQDANGAICKIEDLSYKPETGWEKEWFEHFSGVEQKYRDLALRTVYRWYRIKEFCDETLYVDAFTELDKITDILPLMPKLLEAPECEVEGSVTECCGPVCLDPIVRGINWPNSDVNKNTAADPDTGDELRDHWDFELDVVNGIVKFEYPVIKFDEGNFPLPADLCLLAAFSVCKEDGCINKRFFRGLQTNGEAVKLVRRPDLRVRYVIDSEFGIAKDNFAAIEAESIAHMESLVDRYEKLELLDLEYIGLEKISPSGTIAQVHWESGVNIPPKTRASTGTEFDIFEKPYHQRRQDEQLQEIANRNWLGL